MANKCETNDKPLIINQISCETRLFLHFCVFEKCGYKFNKHIDTLKTSALILHQKKTVYAKN